MSSNHHTILVTLKLNKTKFPLTMYDIITMRKIPYSNVIGSLMHVMVCTWPNIILFMLFFIFHNLLTILEKNLGNHKVNFEVHQSYYYIWDQVFNSSQPNI